MTPGVEIDADRIAVAVTALARVAGPHSGRFGEIAPALPAQYAPAAEPAAAAQGDTP